MERADRRALSQEAVENLHVGRVVGTEVPEGGRRGHGSPGALIAGGGDVGRDHADAGRVDEDAIRFAAIHDFSVAGDNRHADFRGFGKVSVYQKMGVVAPHEMRVDVNARWDAEPAMIGQVFYKRRFEWEEDGYDVSDFAGSGTERFDEESAALLGETDDYTNGVPHESHELIKGSEVSIFVGLTAALFGRIDRVAGWLLVPYAAWVGFAAVLTAAIWRLNG